MGALELVQGLGSPGLSFILARSSFSQGIFDIFNRMQRNIITNVLSVETANSFIVPALFSYVKNP